MYLSTLQLRNTLASAAISAFFNNVTAQQIRAFELRCHQLYPRKRKKNGQVVMTTAASLSTVTDDILDGGSNEVIINMGDKTDVKQRLNW